MVLSIMLHCVLDEWRLFFFFFYGTECDTTGAMISVRLLYDYRLYAVGKFPPARPYLLSPSLQCSTTTITLLSLLPSQRGI